LEGQLEKEDPEAYKEYLKLKEGGKQSII